jgi:hypothetical protein
MWDLSEENPLVETDLRPGFESMLSFYLLLRLLCGDVRDDDVAGDLDFWSLSVEKHFVVVKFVYCEVAGRKLFEES